MTAKRCEVSLTEEMAGNVGVEEGERRKAMAFGMCLGLAKYFDTRLRQIELEYIDLLYAIKDADLVEQLHEEAYSNEPCRQGFERILNCIERYHQEQTKRNSLFPINQTPIKGR
ncbi:hypothetical protein SD70_24885 [Gordoniibacillus kamchatkensis]|uniref:Uncharacterized protein n=1 Tax=Gordoniibacillus kamchatkensis TaxID=1590651 RepID=A0ABR5ACG0_9BACL|nr:hypothetical protein [Paenibacillus sp. VKM B-2647]KIL38687.1 hypothetical protein SD70_24885 [Paenibacillus sp. VKM B-2647]